MSHTATAITDCVVLHTTREEDPWSITYELEVNSLKEVEYCVDFAGSRNLEVIGDSENESLLVKKVVGPFQKQTICKVAAKDPEESLSMKARRSTTIREPPAEILDQHIQKFDEDLVIQLGRIYDCKIHNDTLTIPQLVERCQANDLLFIDPEFPPINLDYPPKISSSLFKNEKGETVQDNSLRVQWRRPKEYLTGEIHIFEGVIEPSDIKQGALGDCWFLCALAALAEFPALVKRLFADESKVVSEIGAYKLQFSKNGQWQDVLVDDLFPCQILGEPLYARCHGNELWVQLVEKAYAKLHGSYNLTRAGLPYEAMIDLTGDPFENYDFSDESVKSMISDGSLFNKLKEYDEQGDLMTVSTPGDDVYTERGGQSLSLSSNLRGLIPGHAYTLIAVKRVQHEGRDLELVQIRNPWGHGEWTGDWSDTSSLWSDTLRKEVQIRNPWGHGEWTGDWSDTSSLWSDTLRKEVGAKNEDDGTFWMSFQDLTSHFEDVNINLCRAGAKERPWNEIRKKSAFHFKQGGHVESFVYELSVDVKSLYYISVHQQDRRVAQAPQYIDIGITIFKLKQPDRCIISLFINKIDELLRPLSL
eukprot:CAMPEP_0182437996 /NCGR_PEP_ID=MMETSP1167-20130531/85437_1 /TAXON_ID=2988 /ORGANISM="Mallomonas Sp, Strain CCMP3275" /LENGTH=588 /DNA_ID=CAMNT_0024631137 /DNA_START=55 /DNA_END=1821 /DNA_ORIENTATION=-